MNKSEKSKLAKALGAEGGKKTYKKYGKKHMVDMINKRWENERAKKQILVGESIS